MVGLENTSRNQDKSRAALYQGAALSFVCLDLDNLLR